MAFVFTTLFMVEAKHWRSLHLDQFLLNPVGHSPLSIVIQKAAADAARAGLHPLVIAKQNHAPTIVLAPSAILELAATLIRARVRGPQQFFGHLLHDGQTGMTTLDNLLTTNPDNLLAEVRQLRPAIVRRRLKPMSVPKQ
jgi:hypothetical protein